MNIKEIGLYFGANVVGGKGSRKEPTKLVCDDLGNNLDYAINEVDAKSGQMVRDEEGRINGNIYLRVYDWGGVEVLIETNNNPFLRVGDELEVKVGNHQVKIEVTEEKEVKFNGGKPNKYTEKLWKKRFSPLTPEMKEKIFSKAR